MQLMISPWEYRHRRGWAQVRIAAAAVLAGLAFVTLTAGAFSAKAVAWAAVFGALSLADLLWAVWLLAIDRSASART